MKEGTRKMWIFFTSTTLVFLITAISLFYKVSFTGDNIAQIIMIYLGFGGIIAGANMGEWFAKSRMK